MKWDGQDKSVAIELGEDTILLKLDEQRAKVNSVFTPLDVPPKLINGSTMVPVRFVTESLGCSVQWLPKTQQVLVFF